MNVFRRIYRILRHADDTVVDQAMVEALPTADGGARRLLVLSLLERGRDEGLVGLVRHLHLLDEPLRQAVAEQMGDSDAALRLACADPEPAAKLNAIELIVHSRSYRLCYLLSEHLHHGDAQVTRAAAGGLLALARILNDPIAVAERHRHPVARRAAWLAGALAEACGCYHQHGRRDVLLAVACMVGGRHEALVRQILDRRSLAHSGMRELLRLCEHEEVQRGLLGFAPMVEFQPAVIEALARRQIGGKLKRLLGQAHLVAAPSIRAVVRRVSPADHLAADSAALEEMTVAELRLAPRWLRALALEPSVRLEALSGVAASGDGVARLLALRAMMAMADESADEAIAPLCHDPEPLLARIALRHLMARSWRGLSRLMVRLLSSPHPEIRRIAETSLAPVGFDGLWSNWEQMEPPVRRAAGRALMKIAPDFHRQLADRMRDADADIRFKAISMARQLEQESYFEQQLAALARDAHEGVARAAADALHVIGGFQQALDDADRKLPRPAVDPVETPTHTEPSTSEEIAHRWRAMPVGEVVASAQAMLSHGEADRRMAAIGALDRLGLTALVRTLWRDADHPTPDREDVESATLSPRRRP